MPNQSTQNPSVAATGHDLVEVRASQPFTTTLVVAEGVKLIHKRVIELVRRYQSDFEEFGLLRFQTAPRLKGQHGGGDVEYAELSEDQATYLITLFRNKPIVRQFKIRLVKDFRRARDEIDRLRGLRDSPDWQKVRVDSIVSFKMQNATLKDMRETHGKTTEAKHYMCEAKLIGYVMTGKFSGIDRNLLSAGDLNRIAELQRINVMLIAQDMPYQERKAILLERSAKRLAA